MALEEQTTLFDRQVYQPLAARLRPAALDEVVGQQHLIGPGKVLRRGGREQGARGRGGVCRLRGAFPAAPVGF